MYATHNSLLIVGIVLLIAAVCEADDAQIAAPISIDPYHVEIDEVENDEGLDLLERAFMKAPRTRRLLPHYNRYLVHLCDSELHQLHSLSNLKRSEFLALQGELESVARRAMLQMCQDQLNGDQVQPGRSAVRLNRVSPSTLIEDTLMDLAERDLTTRQAKLYRDEAMARRNFRREAIVEAITASLDTQVLLSVEQRKQLIELLLKEWQDQWLLCIDQLTSSGIESIPQLPMQQIRDLLKPPQIKVFASMKWKPQAVVFGGSRQFDRAKQKPMFAKLIDELGFAPEVEGATK